MAIIKCKMCGGDLVLVEGSTVATCEFCGTTQTVPSADNEKKLTLFARANRLRSACEFDKAAGIYESIVADFPEEAEAYWGLVLCKYGIEYVDDPGTGKKIPTCHRSSFDSVMDDANFEQAMENADMAAQKVYRDEAKQFERIRKGILEVSSTEKPYDIFICYKETAPNGDRTLDSVLAQDLYSALTDKGYRVFFSRITLQGKLGEAFEPYIFAALNSAKVMLAVGTSYEYYNAVWVKNEWSRYLKICEADKSKHLIPCYKDLDPEDMPKEFNHLQGADLGKMGAIQDILFNMEKYIPLKKQNTTVIHEQVVVGGSGNNKIASLLDRGNMALEDGDWAKADSFFEDVLNNDSKNAQAYLGKTLAMEKCRTIDAFARKRKDATQNVRGEKLSLSPNQSHIDSAAERFRLRGYVDEQAIRKLYTYDLSYHSDLAERQQQYRNEEKYWADHKWLSKAEKFAVGAVAEHLETEKKALFSALAQRVKQAEAAEAAAKKDAQARYEAHLLRADEKAEALFEDGRKRREADYQKLLHIAKNSADVAELTEAAGKFDDLGDYQDSKNLAGHCRNRAKEEQAKLDAEAERQRILKAKSEKERKARIRIISIIAVALSVISIAAVIVVTQVIIPSNNYNHAVVLLENGRYKEAIAAFEALGDYKDSIEQIEACNIGILDRQYNEALVLKETGKYTEAIAAFKTLNGYRDSAEQIYKIQYDNALTLMEAGEYEKAITVFSAIIEYSDSSIKINECDIAILDIKYKEAMTLMDAGKYTEAISAFMELRDYKDSESKKYECDQAVLDIKYNEAVAQIDEGLIVEAYETLLSLNGYKDSTDKANSIYDQYKLEKLKASTVGDYVFFGAYEQDNNPSNGKEDIEWLVLEVKDGKALVISKYALDCQKYNASYVDVTWETCTLRTWLNSTFVNSAFSAKEKAMIPTVAVPAEASSYSYIDSGSDTRDKVFLLSISEVNKYFDYGNSVLNKECEYTDYAGANGVFDRFNWGTCIWWLRSPGCGQAMAADVDQCGQVKTAGGAVNYDGTAVRPAMWISIDE